MCLYLSRPTHPPFKGAGGLRSTRRLKNEPEFMAGSHSVVVPVAPWSPTASLGRRAATTTRT